MADEKKNPLGPTGERVRQNVEHLRTARGLSKKDLSDRTREAGRAIPPLGISRIEAGTRRVDADDLVALALALNVSPLDLLLPPYSNDAAVHLADNYAVTSSTAWAWGMGRQTAMDFEPGGITDVSDDPSSPYAEWEHEQEQEFNRRQADFDKLAGPQELRRAGSNPAVRLVRNLADLIVDLVTPELGTHPGVVETWSRMARRRYKQLGLELDEIDELIENRAYPGVAYPLAEMKSRSSLGAAGRVIPAGEVDTGQDSG